MGKKLRIKAQRPWIGYSGSTLQQNYAESDVHGWLLWEIEERNKFDVTFCELPNPKPFVTIDWKGTVEATLKEAWKYRAESRFRIKNSDALTQQEVLQLTSALRQELRATEVTFKSDHQVNSDIITTTGGATIAKQDLRNPDVLFRLVKEYHKDSQVTESEWNAVNEQVRTYLQNALDVDDMVRNTKWSLRNLNFDNTFTYGEGNIVNFDQLSGIVGIFGPNRVGKSSIVGTIMYSLFNTTDRGNVKNLQVVNVRQPYCYTKVIINVNGTNYVIERQTVKHESKKGQVHAGTALNLFKIDATGEVIDLGGEQRTDTEKVIRKLIGTSEDCLLTSVAAQDDVKLFINQGTSKRMKDLSRFLDLDIFDKMYDQARNDVNFNKGTLKNLPERDWAFIEESYENKLNDCKKAITEKDHLLHEENQKLNDLRAQLSSFKDFTPVTKTQVEAQDARVNSLFDKLVSTKVKLSATTEEVKRITEKIESIEAIQKEHDLPELKKRLEAYRSLESSFESLKHVHEKDESLLKQQERSLKILDDVPCGDSFPTCKFIKDAFKNKEKIEPQREKVERALEKLEKASVAIEELKKEGLVEKVSKIEQLIDLKSKLQVNVSSLKVELVKLDSTISEINGSLQPARQRLQELNEALKNESNVEVVTIRNKLDDIQRSVKRLDVERLALASEAGRIQSDHDKVNADRQKRAELLQLMKAHELIAYAFSRRGIPNLIVASQLPFINAEIAKILNGIVNFSIEMEQDTDSDSMEIYIDYGDSRRLIELASGMEKMIASMAIRVALINVSSLPKTDMFIIDESFGALDNESVEACNRLLISLKKFFRCVIVITHVEGVKDVADHVIEIEKKEKDARVCVK